MKHAHASRPGRDDRMVYRLARLRPSTDGAWVLLAVKRAHLSRSPARRRRPRGRAASER